MLIHPDGMIGSPLAQGADAIRALVAGAVGLPVLSVVPAAASNGHALPLAASVNGNQAAATPVQPALPKVGDPAPAFSLPNLSGKRVNLSDFRGSKTLVLFWNPGCSFCEHMLDDLRAWEANPPAGAPKLLDENMSVGSKFGATGTPMAVLVDAQGKVASEVAAGAPAVLALAGAGSELSTIISL